MDTWSFVLYHNLRRNNKIPTWGEWVIVKRNFYWRRQEKGGENQAISSISVYERKVDELINQ